MGRCHLLRLSGQTTACRPWCREHAIARLHLSQLLSESLGKSLHEEVVEVEMLLYLNQAELQHGMKELTRFPAPHRLYLCQHIEFLVI